MSKKWLKDRLVSAMAKDKRSAVSDYDFALNQAVLALLDDDSREGDDRIRDLESRLAAAERERDEARSVANTRLDRIKRTDDELCAARELLDRRGLPPEVTVHRCPTNGPLSGWVLQVGGHRVGWWNKHDGKDGVDVASQELRFALNKAWSPTTPEVDFEKLVTVGSDGVRFTTNIGTRPIDSHGRRADAEAYADIVRTALRAALGQEKTSGGGKGE